MALIARKGPQGFSLREVARRARVSEAAPYWHFADREALLAAVAERGFVEMAKEMMEIWSRPAEPGERFRALGVGYVHFALAHPSYLRVMFGSEVPDKAVAPRPGGSGERGRSGCWSRRSPSARRRGRCGAATPQALAVAAWSIVHGLAALLVDGKLKDHAGSPAAAERLAQHGHRPLHAGPGSAPVRRLGLLAGGRRAAGPGVRARGVRDGDGNGRSPCWAASTPGTSCSISPEAFDFKDSYTAGLSVAYQFVDWGPHMRWELEGQVLKHFGEQEHVELVASINVRWITFPWNRYLDTSFAFGGGLSQATEVPVLERRDPDSSEAAALLHYLMVEAAFGLPGSPWSVVARLHHRSGIFGLFSHSGSNLLEFGLRYRF